MSRKKKETPPAKGHRINLRITEELYNVLQNEASASNLTLSNYIRNFFPATATIHRSTEVVYDNPKLLQVFRNLASYGNNLNQIAAYLNQGGTMTNPTWKEIKNSNYSATYNYLTTKHDEFTSKSILNEAGKCIPRDEYLIASINCESVVI